jgi:hypothetical protein
MPGTIDGFGFGLPESEPTRAPNLTKTPKSFMPSRMTFADLLLMTRTLKATENGLAPLAT